LPMGVTLASGATVSVVSADVGHSHTLTVRNGTTQVFATGTLVYGALSAPVALAQGSYALIDGTWPWIHGNISVTDSVSDGTLLVGGFYLPAKRLPDYRTTCPANGFVIESEYAFSYQGSSQVLMIFSTNQDLSVAGPKLQAL